MSPFLENIIKHWKIISNIYFYNYLIYCFTIAVIIILFIVNHFQMSIVNIYTHCLIVDFLSPMIAYYSMIYMMILVQSFKSKKHDDKKIKFVKSLYYSWWILALKLLWNFLNIIIMGTTYSPSDKASLFAAFLLFFFWILIFLVSAYFLPRSLFDGKRAYSLYLFLTYIRRASLTLFSAMIISVIVSGFVLLVLAFIFQQILFYIYYCISSANTIELIKTYIEDFLYITTTTLYAHLLAINMLYIYLAIDKEHLKKIAPIHDYV